MNDSLTWHGLPAHAQKEHGLVAHANKMPAKPLFETSRLNAANLGDLIPVVPGAIVSKTLIDTGDLKQILFSMDAGQEMSEHKAPFVATVQMLDGEIDFEVLGSNRLMKSSDWLIMPPSAAHSLVAKQPSRLKQKKHLRRRRGRRLRSRVAVGSHVFLQLVDHFAAALLYFAFKSPQS